MMLVLRRSIIRSTFLTALILSTSLMFFIIPHLFRFVPLDKLQHQAALERTLFTFNNFLNSTAAEVETVPHRTYLITRTPCTEEIYLLIVVITAPANFERREIIRKTWARDVSMKKRWKTMFLVGQVTGDSTLEEHLKAESLMYNDFVRGAQKENYRNLTLKTEMGLEWAAKYCDFQFLLKVDDDVFVNPYRLMEILSKPDTPKTQLYLGRVAARRVVHRDKGKYGVSMEEYNQTRYPEFCNGPAYVLSSDLVHKLVELFDVKNPLKLEDVYIGMLMQTLDVKALRQKGFRLLQLSGSCKHYSDTVAYHRASTQCMVEQFNDAMKERGETWEGLQLSLPQYNDTNSKI